MKICHAKYSILPQGTKFYLAKLLMKTLMNVPWDTYFLSTPTRLEELDKIKVTTFSNELIKGGSYI